MTVTMRGFVALVAKLEPQHWDRPTPCTGWSVLDVVDHVVAGDRFTALTLTGSTLVAASEASRGLDAQNPDVGEQVQDAAETALVAFGGSLDRIIEHRVGPVSARRVLGFRIIDQLGHTWDISTAAGLPAEFDAHALAVGVEITLAERATLERSPNFAPLHGEPDPAGDPLGTFLRAIGRTV